MNYIRTAAIYIQDRVYPTRNQDISILDGKVDSRSTMRKYYEDYKIERERLQDTMMWENKYLIIIHALLGYKWWVFVRFKLYRNILVRLWRVKCFFYHPVRCHLTKIFNNARKFFLKASNCLDLLETRVRNSIPQLKKKECMFPLDIWAMIADNGVSKGNLIRVNKTLFNAFVGDVYRDLTVFLTVSSLEKTKMNDECYLKFGPDFLWGWASDSYPVYLRNKESQNYDYEFLDISNPEKDRGNNCFITNPKAIKVLFDNIFFSHNSILKNYVKNLTVSIHTLHEFDDLIQLKGGREKGINACSSFFSAYKKIPSHYMGQRHSHKFYSRAFFDKFGSDRWGLPKSVLRESFLRRPFSPIENLQATYPYRVYFKELMGVSILFDYFHNIINRRSLSSVCLDEDFREINPFNLYQKAIIEKYGKCPTNKEDMMVYRETVLEDEMYGPMDLEINNRYFYTQSQARELISKIFFGMADMGEAFGEVNRSLVVSAQLGEGDKPEHSAEFDEEDGGYKEPTFVSYMPYVLVFNNPGESKADAFMKKMDISVTTFRRYELCLMTDLEF